MPYPLHQACGGGTVRQAFSALSPSPLRSAFLERSSSVTVDLSSVLMWQQWRQRQQRDGSVPHLLNTGLIQGAEGRKKGKALCQYILSRTRREELWRRDPCNSSTARPKWTRNQGQSTDCAPHFKPLVIDRRTL